MLDAQGGSLEQTLAGYNAGPSRVSDWLSWATYREPAEFVENIPFTETRDYVRKVMNNTMYHSRLFGQPYVSLRQRLGTIGPRPADNE